MIDSLHDITIAAAPEKVFEAWTTSDGLAAWWTADSTAHDDTGDVNTFGFNDGAVRFHFRVDKQRRPGRVRWTGVEGEGMPDEWVGTEIRVDLEPAGAGTRMRFGHCGWRSPDGAYAACNTVWGELMHRLRDHCEGRGRGPFFSG